MYRLVAEYQCYNFGMPSEHPVTSSGIKWNEVTWYSKLGAIILFIGIVPTLTFYIGSQYQLSMQALAVPIPTITTTAKKTEVPVQNISGKYVEYDYPDSSFTINAGPNSQISIDGVANINTGLAYHQAIFIGTTTIDGNSARFELDQGQDNPCVLLVTFAPDNALLESIDTVDSSGINACADWGEGAKPDGAYEKQ